MEVAEEGLHFPRIQQTISVIVVTHEGVAKYFHLAVNKRPLEELYDVANDPANLNNLAADPKHAALTKRLREEFLAYLKKTGDPRVVDGGEIYEKYKRYSRIRKFPKPGESR